MVTKHTAFRIPAEMVARIDAFAKVKAATDGRPCSRTDAVLYLLDRALARETAKRSSRQAGPTEDED